MAVDAIAAAHGFAPWRAKFQGQVAEGRLGPERVLLLKPGTYMNLSGDSVRAAMGFFKLEPADVVAFHDELDLAPGRVRVKTGGGTAGHNGLRSLGAHIGPDFTRVRIGIGHPGDKRLVVAPRARRLRQGRRRLARRPAARRGRRRAGARRRRHAGLPERHRPPRRAAARSPSRPRPPRSPSRRRRPRPRTPAARCSGWSTASGDGRATPSAPRPSTAPGMGSPFTARLCRLLADRLAPGDPVSDRVLAWPGDPSHRADALPLRLAGALHGLVRRGPRRRPGRGLPAAPRGGRRRRPLGGGRRRLRRARAVRARPPRRPAADQRDPAQRRARPWLPDRRGADRPAARHLRDRRQRRPEPDAGTASPTPSAPPPGATRPRRCAIAPDWQGPPPPLPAAPRRRARRLRPRPARPRPRGRPAAPRLLRLGRPDRAAWPARRAAIDARPRRRHPGRARPTPPTGSPRASPSRGRAGRTSSTTRSSGSTSPPRQQARGAARASTPPARGRRRDAPLAWLRMEARRRRPRRRDHPDALARRRDAPARPRRLPRRLGALDRLGLSRRDQTSSAVPYITASPSAKPPAVAPPTAAPPASRAR